MLLGSGLVAAGELMPPLEGYRARPEWPLIEAALERQEAVLELALSGPAEAPTSRRQEDEALKSQLVTLVKRFDAAEARWARVPETDPALRLLKLAGQAELSAYFAEALLGSHVPSYLTADQREIYGMALEDKAYPKELAALEMRRELVSVAYGEEMYLPWVMAVRTWLMEEGGEGWRVVVETPPPWSSATRELADIAAMVRGDGWGEGHARLWALPLSPAVHHDRGVMAWLAGDLDHAEAHFTAAGEPVSARLAEAAQLRQQGAPAEAEALYTELLSVPSPEPLAWWNARVFGEICFREADRASRQLARQPQVRALHAEYNERLLAYLDVFSLEVWEDACAPPRSPPARPGPSPSVVQERKDALRLLQQRIDYYRDPPRGCVIDASDESGLGEMMLMVLEQAQMVVDAEEHDMVSDIMLFFEDMEAQLFEVQPACEPPALRGRRSPQR